MRYSEDLENVISWMIQKEPEKRPTVNDLLDIPKIQLRMRERQMREDYATLKLKEQTVHQKYDDLKLKEKELANQEKALLKREEKARNLKIKLAE